MGTAGRRARAAAWLAAGVLGAGTVAGIVVSQIGLANADGSSSTQQTAPYGRMGSGMGGYGMDGYGMHGRGGGPGAGVMHGLGGRAIHGEMKVEVSKGKYQTVVTQLGTISSISGKQVTVKSDDGFTATYTVDDSTRIVKDRAVAKLTDLAKGQTVRVMAVQSGSTLTAKAIHEGMWRMGPPDADDTPGGSNQSSSNA